ncbi:phage holin family protein [Actinomadura sp. KC216]|uniref:phage holin family protein n=1 Tax=Actinomadura sp. KC216 TaxID=2530370 RepID=UPI00104FF376|nr:phage holin family protein [Actinomadura sp. KC216]TDB82928.1 phage holin family protein [Actinomadura sp. KC216]
MSEPLPGDRVEDKSLGDLATLALSEMSDIIRLEMELARVELKADAKKAAVSSVMFTIAAVMGGIVVILLSISFAYGLIGLGLWRWAAFLIVAAVYVVLAVGLMLVAKRLIKKIEGAKRTRKSLKSDLSKLRRRGDSDTPELTG